MSKNDIGDEVSCWIQSVSTEKLNPKANARFHRDLSDGCLVAHVLKRSFPKLVEMHNYGKASSIKSKKDNWQHLRRAVFAKIGIKLSDENLSLIAEGKPGGIEPLLKQIYNVVMKAEADKRRTDEMKVEEQRRDALPPPEWVPANNCQLRKLHDGTEEIMYKGRIFCYKDKAEEGYNALLREMEQAKTLIKQLKSQAARLQITVGLKEARLEDLTNELQQIRIQMENSHNIQ